MGWRFTAGSAGGFRELRRGTLRTHFELSKEDRLGHLKAGSFRKHGLCRVNENFAADGEFPPPSTGPRVVPSNFFWFGGRYLFFLVLTVLVDIARFRFGSFLRFFFCFYLVDFFLGYHRLLL